MSALCPKSSRRKAARSVDRAKLLSVKQAAEYLNISVWKLRQLVAMGTIEPVQFGANTSPLYFTRQSLDKLIKEKGGIL